MNERRLETLRSVVVTFAPADARIERVTELAAEAIDGLTPRRRHELEQLLDLLRLPMRAGDAPRGVLLRAFADAPFPKLRTAFAVLKRLSLFLAYAESEPGSENPTWGRIGYPGPRHDANAGVMPLPLAVASDGERVRAEVVVIGSGAGGGVIASAFARAGKRVVVLEAGGAYDARTFTQRELMTSELYLDGGLTSTSDLGIAILAGATVGGGTAVNWCTALRLPARIAQEWTERSGISQLDADLDPHYASIERRLEIQPIANHNANNRTILDGARALGVHGDASPRNAATSCGDGCGYCGFGCAYNKKRSTAATFLYDVASAGGAIYAHANALRVESIAGRARGVVVRQVAAPGELRSFEVEADLVVVCAGTLRTPGILARSGIANPLLGKRLFLHPVAAAIAEFDRAIEPWTGPMQSAYSDAFNYRRGNYGVKVEVAPAHPGLGASSVPWRSRAGHAEQMERMRNVATLFALTRDRDPGSIDLDEEAYIRYGISQFDGENLLAGLAGLFDLGFAAGAVRMTTLHARPIEIEREAWTESRRRAFARQLRRIGVSSNRQILFSAHQMGTAAMGSGPGDSVVDPNGCVWGYKNLLVADGSVFPQSSGVNPMLTIMAMASRIAALNGGATAVV
ncbi:MAG TPA: GMC family oxidoreductase N-terminal domain-containing protein [Candidatus Babeliales bacterium]|nr:GMC family oxidoreductase N-terminal domain-containing protein [Candidatus Babeliales bacterium]